MAHLLAAYTEAWGSGVTGPSGEDVLTTRPGSPPASMRGTKAWMPWATPNTLTAKVQRQSLGVVSHTLAAGGPTPALLQSRWTAPWRS
jgi:hypothetical protein